MMDEGATGEVVETDSMAVTSHHTFTILNIFYWLERILNFDYT
jgi:hypothetical protein